jgi:hypothetical protein
MTLQPTSLLRLAHVLRSRPRRQMGRVCARAVVASVHRVEALRERADEVLVHQSVNAGCPFAATAALDDAVAVRGCAWPHPTRLRVGRIEPRKDPIDQWLGRVLAAWRSRTRIPRPMLLKPTPRTGAAYPTTSVDADVVATQLVTCVAVGLLRIGDHLRQFTNTDGGNAFVRVGR